MLARTRQALKEYDNEHDFERMCADILNAEGYFEVVPQAPRGGADAGRDITFALADGARGLACCTLRQDIDKKFNLDFCQRRKGEYSKYVLFCTTYLSARQKKNYARYCLENLDAEFTPFDLEALTSLLDGRMHDIRNKYLTCGLNTEDSSVFNIDDGSVLKVRKVVNKTAMPLLRSRRSYAEINESYQFGPSSGLTETARDKNSYEQTE